MDDTHKQLAQAVELVLPGKSRCYDHIFGGYKRKPLPELVGLAEGWLRKQGVTGFITLFGNTSYVRWKQTLEKQRAVKLLGVGSNAIELPARAIAAAAAIGRLKGEMP